MTPTPAKPTRFADTYDIRKKGNHECLLPPPSLPTATTSARSAGAAAAAALYLPARYTNWATRPESSSASAALSRVVRRVGLTAALRQLRFTPLGRWLHEIRQRGDTR